MEFLKLAIIFLFLNRISSAEKAIILDTTTQSTLRWTTYTSSRASEEGWLEESYTNAKDGVNWRSYVVCDVKKDYVNNWLRTPYIQIGDARRLSVEITFTLRDCRKFPHTARTCKETFSLLAYESDVDFATKDQPVWTDVGVNSYRRIDRLTAANGRFSEQDQVPMNVETRQLAVTKKGVYIALRDEGACISLLALKVYYEVCAETTVNFVTFPETPVGANMTTIQEVKGKCVDNASPPPGSINSKYFCKGDGTWDLLSGGCQCNPGYRADGHQRCLPCDSGFYKDTPGISGCTSCPSRSKSKYVGASWCECDKGSYRLPSESNSSPCTVIPSAPRELIEVKKNLTQIVLSWTAPSELGSRSNYWYRIECAACSSDIVYVPRKNRLNTTSVTLMNLEAGTRYTINVYVEDDFTIQMDKNFIPSYATINTSTLIPNKGSDMNIIRVDSISDTHLSISWDIPTYWKAPEMDDLWPSPNDPPKTTMNPEQKRNSVKFYAVRLYSKDQETGVHKIVDPKEYSKGIAGTYDEMTTTFTPSFTFRDLMPKTHYGFQVRASTTYGWSPWTTIYWTKTNATFDQVDVIEYDPNSGIYTPGTILGIVAGGVILLGIIIVVIAIVWRRNRNTPCRGKQSNDMDVLSTKKNPLTIVHCHQHAPSDRDGPLSRARVMSPFLANVLNEPNAPSLFGSFSSRQYIDPLTYEDPNRRLNEFANEIDSKDITIEEVIGEGEFGKVCKGKLLVSMGVRRGHIKETVAIKTLKPGSSEKSKSDFLMEASIMGQFDHANVIKLKGVVTRREPVMIITEFVENGSLDRFLQANKIKLKINRLITMLRGIACGMTYLSDMGYVHRDLAARNILVDKSLLCKIADFGLSRGLIDGSNEQIYMTQGGKIPVRWTSPEALTYRKFTSASDVWSFGVVMWEVMSFGQRPYGQWTNQDVIVAIENGYRLEIPEGCPQAVYELMFACWQQERHLRPLFLIVLQTLDKFLQYPETLYGTRLTSNGSSPISQNSGSLTSLPSSIACMRPSTSGINNHHPSTGSSSGFVSITAGNHNPLSTLGPVAPSSSSDYFLSQIDIKEFLRELQLEHLASIFEHKNRHNVLDLTRLTIVDFASLGVQVQDQNRIRDAIERLRRQQYYGITGGATLPRRTYQVHERPSIGPPPPPASLSRRLQTNSNNMKNGYFV